MRARRFLLTSVVLICVAIAWNALVHLVVFREANASVQHLRRPDIAEKAWLSLVLTAGIVMAFVWAYGRCARTGSLREGLGYGVFFAALAGLLVDLNQYVLFPLLNVTTVTNRWIQLSGDPDFQSDFGLFVMLIAFGAAMVVVLGFATAWRGVGAAMERPDSAYSFAAPSTLLRSRSKVPSGRCPAFRASSTRRQSENPNVGRSRNVSSAAATASGSWSVSC